MGTTRSSSERSAPPVAVITGASQGLGLALAEALADEGWALVIDARRADRLDAAVARLATRTRVVGVAGDVTDPEHRAGTSHAVAADLGPVTCSSTTRARSAPARSRRSTSITVEPGATSSRSTWSRRSRSTQALDSARSSPAHDDREHHVRRRGRGLRGLGRLRLVEGRARARYPRCSPPSSPTCGCSSSTPATCAPRCTRTRSPARTSPTGRCPRRACPGCVALIEGDQPERPLPARGRWCHDRRYHGARHDRADPATRSTSCSTPRTRRTSRPRRGAGGRDDVRLLVSNGDGRPVDARDVRRPRRRFLRAGRPRSS